MKIGVVIPDRGDRPEFLKNCMRMLAGQTILPAELVVVGPEKVAPGEACDITKRYRTGYDMLRGKGLDVIAFMENDDWYAPDYLERMAEQWELAGRPDLLGTAYTIYYHIGLHAWLTMEHRRRANAMNTFIKPDLAIDWCADSEPYTDIHLWQPTPKSPKGDFEKNSSQKPVVFAADMNSTVERVGYFNIIKPKPGYGGGGIDTRVTFSPMEVFKRHISVGIKHGVGLCGGRNHTNYLERYKFNDAGMVALMAWVGVEACAFYKKAGEAATPNP